MTRAMQVTSVYTQMGFDISDHHVSQQKVTYLHIDEV